jgi:hypothetical protein
VAKKEYSQTIQNLIDLNETTKREMKSQLKEKECLTLP